MANIGVKVVSGLIPSLAGAGWVPRGVSGRVFGLLPASWKTGGIGASLEERVLSPGRAPQYPLIPFLNVLQNPGVNQALDALGDVQAQRLVSERLEQMERFLTGPEAQWAGAPKHEVVALMSETIQKNQAFLLEPESFGAMLLIAREILPEVKWPAAQAVLPVLFEQYPGLRKLFDDPSDRGEYFRNLVKGALEQGGPARVREIGEILAGDFRVVPELVHFRSLREVIADYAALLIKKDGNPFLLLLNEIKETGSQTVPPAEVVRISSYYYGISSGVRVSLTRGNLEKTVRMLERIDNPHPLMVELSGVSDLSNDELTAFIRTLVKNIRQIERLDITYRRELRAEKIAERNMALYHFIDRTDRRFCWYVPATSSLVLTGRNMTAGEERELLSCFTDPKERKAIEKLLQQFHEESSGDWLRELSGLKVGEFIFYVNRYREEPDGLLRQVAEVSSVKKLSFQVGVSDGPCECTGESLPVLLQLPNLKELTLVGYTEVPGRCLAPLAKHPTLKTIRLFCFNKLTVADLAVFNGTGKKVLMEDCPQIDAAIPGGRDRGGGLVNFIGVQYLDGKLSTY